MSLSLRKLLRNPALNLRLVVEGAKDASVEQGLDREFEWLHATDMIDPIQFLGPAEVILTLGWQFPVTQSADPAIPEVRVASDRLAKIYDEYAALVAAHGVIGIGFGSDVVHRGVPQQLALACMRHGLLLFDVPYEISFMDLLQEAARVMQRDQTERYTRSLRAQKAIANAAIRKDGLTATLRETARQLGCGVALFDPLGHPVTVVDSPDGPQLTERELRAIVQQTLENEQRFRSTQASSEVEAILQILGEPGDPQGVLVLTLSREFDDISRNVLSSVLALVSVSLEQNQSLATLHATLREALLQLLLAGNVAGTRHIIQSVWGPLPPPPVSVLIGIPRHFDAARLIPGLESMYAADEFAVFFAQYGTDVALLVAEQDLQSLAGKLHTFGMVLGRSRVERWDNLAVGLDEAKKAAEFGLRTGAQSITDFTDIWHDGLADLIDASDAAHVARRLLGPLGSHDAEHGTELVHTLRCWLSEHGRPLPAARELGIHRHTLNHRLELIAKLTGVDLEDFQARADLALALRYYKP